MEHLFIAILTLLVFSAVYVTPLILSIFNKKIAKVTLVVSVLVFGFYAYLLIDHVAVDLFTDELAYIFTVIEMVIILPIILLAFLISLIIDVVIYTIRSDKQYKKDKIEKNKEEK